MGPISVNAAPPQNGGLKISLDWLPDRAKTQREVFESLAKIAGEPIPIDAPFTAPTDAPLDDYLDLRQYLSARHRTASPTSATKVSPPSRKAATARVVGENLRLAQTLLADKNPQRQNAGLIVAHDAALKTAMRVGDGALGARIFSGFILGSLDAAPDALPDAAQVNFEALPKRRLLQDACAAYRYAKDDEAFFASIALLVLVADKAGDVEAADWARVKLADVLAQRERFAEAIRSLRAVTSPNLAGAKIFIPDLEKKLAAQKVSATTTVTPTAEGEAPTIPAAANP